ncbi:SIT4-associating protein Sap155p [[Candida] anglica]|uniref:SIT4-associating protein Sap155p n=1 Tax=[Candida] anglica TaxID=148631 RepID=A0ABP0E9P5_9ASCO
MSFWPFSNSLNNNSRLQKFLDTVTDVSSVSVEDLVVDPELSSELISELHNIKGNYSKNALSFPISSQYQQSQNEESNSNSLTSSSMNGETASVSSFNNESSSNSKDTRGAKLLEILIQPHILNGFLDYIVQSVVFFHELSLQENTTSVLDEVNDTVEVENGSAENPDSGDKLESVKEDLLENSIKEEDEDEPVDEESAEEKLRRYIQVSSDVLSLDLWIISNRIIETPIIMSKLWSVLSLPELGESSPTVSYLVHILDQLMDANSIELLNFVRRQPNLVDIFLEKIEIPMLMDFFLRIIQTDKADSPTGILETLSSQQLIVKLVEILKPHPSQFVPSSYGIPDSELFFKQTAATDFLKALVTISSNTALAINLDTNIGPNQLTRELVSRDVIRTMVEDIILFRPPKTSPSSTNKHGINNCVGIIIELIRKNNSDYDSNCGIYSVMLQQNGGNAENGGGSEINSYVMFQWLKDFEQNPPGVRDPIYLGDMLEIFSDHLGDMSELMNISQSDSNTETLGFTNFKISELIAELLHCSNMILLNSKKIKKVIQVREYVRSQQCRRLKRALNESIVSDNFSENGIINDVTHGLDDVSLDNVSLGSNNVNLGMSSLNNKKPASVLSLSPQSLHHNSHSETIATDDEISFSMDLDIDENDSEDEEPVISPENPFVDKERDETIRVSPCVGDKFKIDLVDSGILSLIVKKFIAFPWHNFFHNVVFDLIQQIFNGKLNSYNSFLIVELFKEEQCDLTGLIIDSYKNVTSPRPGYMGHLILISEEIVKFTSLYKPDLISPVIVQAISCKGWEWFVSEVLLKTREIYNAVLGADNDDVDIEGLAKNSGDIDESDSFGFDSSTVGYLDLDAYDHGQENSKIIVLGDKSNHDRFVNETPVDNGDGEEGEDEDEVRSNMPDVPISSLHSMTAHGQDSIDDDESQEENDFLENLSGSSSSDEEDDDEEEEEEEEEDADDDNELRRVPKHSK